MKVNGTTGAAPPPAVPEVVGARKSSARGERRSGEALDLSRLEELKRRAEGATTDDADRAGEAIRMARGEGAEIARTGAERTRFEHVVEVLTASMGLLRSLAEEVASGILYTPDMMTNEAADDSNESVDQSRRDETVRHATLHRMFVADNESLARIGKVFAKNRDGDTVNTETRGDLEKTLAGEKKTIFRMAAAAGRMADQVPGSDEAVTNGTVGEEPKGPA